MKIVHCRYLLCIFAAILLTGGNGCSVIGFGAGAFIDKTTPPETKITPEQKSIPSNGTRLRIVLENDEIFVGKLKNVYPVPESLYSPVSRYRNEHNRRLSSLPAKCLTLETEIEECTLAGKDIMNIYKINSRRATERGLQMGIVVDILLVWRLLNSKEQLRWVSTSGIRCPHSYYGLKTAWYIHGNMASFR